MDQNELSSHTSNNSPQLARKIGFPLLTFYGIGTILGAGIYVLVGKVAAVSGLLAPLAFLIAGLVAWVTAMSYCQLVMNYPKSAGEAHYVEEGFGIPKLTTLVGYLVIFTGIVSAATLAHGFVGYLTAFIDISPILAIVIIIVFMGVMALWGIAESLWLAAIITVVEITGLLLVIVFGGHYLGELPNRINEVFVQDAQTEIALLMSGAFIAFYAFIGFEDMVNVAEEVKEPSRIMPKAIITAVILSTLLYFFITAITVLGLPMEQLESSGAPLKELLSQENEQASQWVGLISLFAIVNGVLTQIIMASRVLYGMAMQERAPEIFSFVEENTRTPWIATLTITTVILIFALWLPIVSLAKTTTFIILIIFVLVNLTLWRLKRTNRINTKNNLPSWPLLGVLLSLGLLLYQVIQLLF
ncbi:APC family permease [Litoribrevibacter euphylliae]|uniref:APC family permease n=1 Tax=Litoribrevibacter euphylliae TaxID=1834034 RepID=A0ABV7HFS8_9GAMM